ncbi:hypothetical protein BpHYR1_020759 [Brachionus plicatilis]|uniref:Uncharacterized protein n=1 Tax=Brachionus plicatilis TaxID=10195 RepID=A0A3M7SKN5_BRAPC|nr:hypothetical protein BpHYR1_020759 [Brachionus plicatilis]
MVKTNFWTGCGSDHLSVMLELDLSTWTDWIGAGALAKLGLCIILFKLSTQPAELHAFIE